MGFVCPSLVRLPEVHVQGQAAQEDCLNTGFSTEHENGCEIWTGHQRWQACEAAPIHSRLLSGHVRLFIM